MKNKRTKLTALALSALMAVSTISSVTWAADLFSDGSEGTEVVAEDAEAFASSEEEVTVTEDVEQPDEAENLMATVVEADSDGAISFHDPWDGTKYTRYDPSDPAQQGEGRGVFVDPNDGKYKFTYVDNTDSTKPNNEKTVEAKATDIKEDATCEHPARVQVSVSLVIEGDDVSPYIKGQTVSGNLWYYDLGNETNYEKEKHHVKVVNILEISDVSAKEPSCEDNLKSISYTECSVCHKLLTSDKVSSSPWKYLNDGSKDITESQSIYDELKSNYNPKDPKYGLKDDEYEEYVTIDDLGIREHVAGTIVMTTLPPKTVNDLSYGEYEEKIDDGSTYNGYSDLKAFNNGFSSSVTNYFNTKANCEVNNNVHSGAMDPTRDAYVYNVTFCKFCGKVISISKDVFYHTENMTEGTEFYMAVKNIAFFMGTDKHAYFGRIRKDLLDFVVLDNCELDGVYNLCVTSKNYQGEDSLAYTVAGTEVQPHTHQWKAPIVKAVGYEPTDSKIKDLFANVTPYTSGNTTYYYINPEKVDGEWQVKAKYCNTNAYYTWEQHCWNPKCKYNDFYQGKGLESQSPYKYIPTVDPKYMSDYFGKSNLDGGQRKAVPGPHVWMLESDVRPDGRPGRFVDPASTEYFQIKDENGEVDMKHHREHYHDSVMCKICYHEEVLKGTKNDSNKPDATVDHIFVSQPDPDVERTEPTCGTTGSFERVDTCVCKLKDESTREKVTIPATDKHDFGNNQAQIVWSGGENDDGNGAVYIADRFVPGVSLHADIVRECTVCHQLDSNGINTMLPGNSKPMGDVEITMDYYAQEHFDKVTWTPAGKWCAVLRVGDIDPAETDPATGIAFRCSTAHATISVDWVGTVDGKVVELNKDTRDNAVKENIPYYKSVTEYQARTAHTPGKPQKEGDQIVTRCTVCGDIVKSEPDTTPNVGVPAVTAASVDFDTVNVSWTKVDGATAYRLYYRSSDEGISKWAKIRTFTGDTTSYAVNGLTTGSKYRFTVRAEITQDGKTTLGDYSKKGAVAVPKLTAPEIKSVTASGKTTKVTWSRVDGASGYIVFRNSQRVGTVTKGSKVTWTDKKPVSGAKYQVRAYRTEAKKNFKSDLSEPK